MSELVLQNIYCLILFVSFLPHLALKFAFFHPGIANRSGNADPNEPLGLHAVEEDVEVLLHCSQGMLDPWLHTDSRGVWLILVDSHLAIA